MLFVVILHKHLKLHYLNLFCCGFYLVVPPMYDMKIYLLFPVC